MIDVGVLVISVWKHLTGSLPVIVILILCPGGLNRKEYHHSCGHKKQKGSNMHFFLHLVSFSVLINSCSTTQSIRGSHPDGIFFLDIYPNGKTMGNTGGIGFC